MSKKVIINPEACCCLTHHAPHCDPEWLAIHRDSALELLDDYNLTDEQKNDAGALMAGYCRLIEEAGLVHYGNTEQEAIEAALRENFKPEPAADCSEAVSRHTAGRVTPGIVLRRTSGEMSEGGDKLPPPIKPQHLDEEAGQAKTTAPWNRSTAR